MVYMKSDLVMLEFLRGPADVGQYSVASRVAESLYFLPIVLARTFTPKLGHSSENFRSDLEVRRLYRVAWQWGLEW